MTRGFVVGVVLLLSATTVFNQSKPSPTVQGVWRIVEVTTTGPTATTNSNPQPSLYIFTPKHYSIMRVQSTSARPVTPDLNDTTVLNKATSAELLAIWGNVAANSGTYEISGSRLTTRPAVAKNPSVMASGAFTERSYKLDGNNLWLTTTRTQTGAVANPTTYKLSRVE